MGGMGLNAMGFGSAPPMGLSAMQSMGATMQQSRHARRIYVGGIGELVNEAVSPLPPFLTHTYHHRSHARP